MTIHAFAGKPAPKELLVDLDKLRKEYYTGKPDITNSAERVSFGTSGHRGSSLRGGFNEAHVLAITQAICEYRNSQNVNGPLYIGKDTHALSGPAFMTVLEVLAANGVETMVDRVDGYTPTPVISHAILSYNRGRTSGRADGIVITPSPTRRKMAASNTTRRTAGWRIPTPRVGSKIEPITCSRVI
jgi:phosphoglucomutase